MGLRCVEVPQHQCPSRQCRRSAPPGIQGMRLRRCQVLQKRAFPHGSVNISGHKGEEYCTFVQSLNKLFLV